MVSITIPIVLVECLFPSRAGVPWLGRRGMRAFGIWLGVVSVVDVFLFGFVAFRAQGYGHPPAIYLGALALAATLAWLALHLQPQRLAALAQRTAPTLGTLRLRALLATVGFFFLLWVAPSFVASAAVTFVALAALGGYMVWRVGEWSRGIGWTAEHRLALASGVLFFFILLAPVLEATQRTKPMAGMTLSALLWLAGLVWLARRTGRPRAAMTVGVA